MERIISVDFDNTIAHTTYPKIHKLRKGAKKYINKLYDEGFGIVINTCRAKIYQKQAEDFLKNKGIKYHHINENFPHLIDIYGFDCRKISADVYIDDKCLFELPEWEQIYKIIKQKWHK